MSDQRALLAAVLAGKYKGDLQRACGFRNRDRFRNAIYSHLGGLVLYPPGVSAKA